jgi:nucleoside-diphosphate-sugar epimerase
MAKLIVGCGYLGSRVARLWQAAGETVWATTRSAEHAREFERQGLRPLALDVLDPHSFDSLPAVETVVHAVSYGRALGGSLVEAHATGMRNVLDRLDERTRRFIYISSTGVYGDFHGAWVDEDSPCRPDREGGRGCLAAESLLAASRFADRSIVLRLAGLYGPDRLPRIASLLAGEPIRAPETGFLNLIHVDDAARVVLLAEATAPLPRLYLVSDGHPVERREYYSELARLSGAPAPNFAPAAETPAADRAAANKRISNARLMAELKPTLVWPSYREVLAERVRSHPGVYSPGKGE